VRRANNMHPSRAGTREQCRSVTAQAGEVVRWPDPSPLAKWWRTVMTQGRRNAAT
jgi:hypothetical protein